MCHAHVCAYIGPIGITFKNMHSSTISWWCRLGWFAVDYAWCVRTTERPR